MLSLVEDEFFFFFKEPEPNQKIKSKFLLLSPEKKHQCVTTSSHMGDNYNTVSKQLYHIYFNCKTIFPL